MRTVRKSPMNHPSPVKGKKVSGTRELRRAKERADKEERKGRGVNEKMNRECRLSPQPSRPACPPERVLSARCRLVKKKEEKKGGEEVSPQIRNNDRRKPDGAIACSVSFRIEKETNDKMQDICAREGISKSALMKRLIRQYVEEHTNG